jgi:colanic acid/amylovoran biosynthesis glycosyltransferase
VQQNFWRKSLFSAADRRGSQRENGQCEDGQRAAALPEVTLIYRDRLLPYSETFILAQGERCQHCRYVGLSAVSEPGLGEAWQNLLKRKSVILTAWPSVLWRLAYRLWGKVPSAWMRSLIALRPRLIHAHFGPDGGYATSLAQALNLPLIVTFHGYDATWRSPSQPPDWLDLGLRPEHFFRQLALQRRYVPFRSAIAIVAVSQFIGTRLIELGCPPEKIVVHYTGIDLAQFRPDPTQVRQPIVLFVGRLVEKKGVSLLIAAMAQVQAEYPAAQLVIIGDGGLRCLLEKQAHSLLHCRFLGAQPPEQVRHWMNQAWLLCAPSITAASGDAEGLGMALLEAQAMGLPVVASRSGGIPEAVIDQQTGMLVAEGDVTGLTAAILHLLKSKAGRDRLAQAGRRHVEQRFDLAQNTPRLEALYDSVVRCHRLAIPFAADQFESTVSQF